MVIKPLQGHRWIFSGDRGAALGIRIMVMAMIDILAINEVLPPTWSCQYSEFESIHKQRPTSCLMAAASHIPHASSLRIIRGSISNTSKGILEFTEEYLKVVKGSGPSVVPSRGSNKKRPNDRRQRRSRGQLEDPQHYGPK